MKRLKTLLMVPPGGYYAERWAGGVLMPSLGIGYLAATIEQAGFPVQILDAHVHALQPEAIMTHLQDYHPDIIGLTFTTENRFEAFRTARIIKTILPASHLTAGGPHASLAAEDTLEGIAEFDSIVIGEGENTFLELLAAVSAGSKYLSNVNGIAYRTETGAIVVNPPRSRIEDLNQIPFPARHLFPPPDVYNFRFNVPGHGTKRFSNIMTSRGCPCACNFCATPKVWGRHVRMRSPENIIAEIDQMVEMGQTEALWFFDDTFNTSPRRVEQFCGLLKDRGYHLPWFCEIRVDNMSKSLLETMRDAGCYTIGFGVESGSQRILDEIIQKNLKLQKVRELYQWCRELNVIANPFFILSHPTETWEEAQETLDLIREFKEGAHVSMAFLHVYPGTDLEKTARENGTLPVDFRWYHENRTDVKTLPSAQGNVPIFTDKLSWSQLSDILFEWASMQNYSVWRKIPKVLKSIRSIDDLKRYATMGFRYFRRLMVH